MGISGALRLPDLSTGDFSFCPVPYHLCYIAVITPRGRYAGNPVRPQE